ncbi:hypothetical protein [Methanosarcina mazei]|uniref:hypothetical protein n=1 Tax=Methanosarcina mazei TaxID=2209 RepID=UPI000B12B973|nr:hypothetical protein [Methanosarcina mazei]MDO5841554.1 hypothetical protein [Methanosarcina mazei]
MPDYFNRIRTKYNEINDKNHNKEKTKDIKEINFANLKVQLLKVPFLWLDY